MVGKETRALRKKKVNKHTFKTPYSGVEEIAQGTKVKEKWCEYLVKNTRKSYFYSLYF